MEPTLRCYREKHDVQYEGSNEADTKDMVRCYTCHPKKEVLADVATAVFVSVVALLVLPLATFFLLFSGAVKAYDALRGT
jgi:hypothetical protein